MPEKKFTFPLVIGVAVGVTLGLATENLVLWISMGLLCGLLFGYFIRQRRNPDP